MKVHQHGRQLLCCFNPQGLSENALLSPIVLYHPTLCHGHFLRMLLYYKIGQVQACFCKQTSVAACRFQKECNKVEIALRVVQFWSAIRLVITNRTPASRSCDFVIRHLFGFRPNCTPLSAITIIYTTGPWCVICVNVIWMLKTYIKYFFNVVLSLNFGRLRLLR